MSDPVTAFEEPLLVRLKGNAPLTTYLGGTFIFNHVAWGSPPATGYVIMQHQVGISAKTMGPNGGNDNESALYYIKGVVGGPENVERARDIFALIDTAVNGKS